MQSWSQPISGSSYLDRGIGSIDAPFRDAVALLGEMRWEDALGAWRACYDCFQTSYLSKIVFVDLSIRLGHFDDAWVIIDSERCFAAVDFPLHGIWQRTKKMWSASEEEGTNSIKSLITAGVSPNIDPFHKSLNVGDVATLFELRRYGQVVSILQRNQEKFSADIELFSFYLKSLFSLGKYEVFLLELNQHTHLLGGSSGKISLYSSVIEELLDIKTRAEVRLQRRSDSIPKHVQRFKASLAYRHTEALLLRCEDLTVQKAILTELASFNKVVGVFGDNFRIYSV